MPRLMMPEDSHTGGTILLAPAAASFDQFDNFGARGDAFCQIANTSMQPHRRGLCLTAQIARLLVYGGGLSINGYWQAP